jgi:predicted secreted protein
MAMKGINARLKVSTTAGGAGTYTEVAEFNEAEITIGADSIDASVFGTSAWAQTIQGRKDVNITASGFLVPGDTNGQVAIRSAQLNDTELWAQWLWDGTSGWKAQYRVRTFSCRAGAGSTDVVTCNIALEGTGAATIV